ncbi:hypothetical protein PMAYCL1PPCAC_27605, partial [Pristionchus mayeri]
IGRVLQEAIKGENIKANLRALTKEPHQAGTKANERVARTIEKIYKDAGLQNVHTLTCDVLLGYPDWERPNTILINDKSGRSIFTSHGVTYPILPDEKDAGHQWLAYSAPGRAEGDIVYAHSGTKQDFLRLKKMGMDVTGKIAMMRYGESFRGDKLMIACDRIIDNTYTRHKLTEHARPSSFPIRLRPRRERKTTSIRRVYGCHRRVFNEARLGSPVVIRSLLVTLRSRAHSNRVVDIVCNRIQPHILSRMSGPQVPDEW